VLPDALAVRDAATVVFVVRDGKLAAVPVTRGIAVGDVVAIKGEVKNGEKVVLSPSAALAPGEPVKIVQK
jgi:hypothetical protein